VAAPDTDARRPTRACHPEAHVDNPAHHPPECHWSTQPQGCDTSRRHMPIDCPHAADGTASKIGVENSLSFRDEGGGHAGDSAHQQSRPDLLRPKPADGCRDRVGGIRQPHLEHGRERQRDPLPPHGDRGRCRPGPIHPGRFETQLVTQQIVAASISQTWLRRCRQENGQRDPNTRAAMTAWWSAPVQPSTGADISRSPNRGQVSREPPACPANRRRTP